MQGLVEQVWLKDVTTVASLGVVSMRTFSLVPRVIEAQDVTANAAHNGTSTTLFILSSPTILFNSNVSVADSKTIEEYTYPAICAGNDFHL